MPTGLDAVEVGASGAKCLHPCTKACPCYEGLSFPPSSALPSLPQLLHLHHFHVPLPVLAELCAAATGLVSLDVSSCGLAGALPPAVTGLGRLGELRLAHNALTGWVGGWVGGAVAVVFKCCGIARG